MPEQQQQVIVTPQNSESKKDKERQCWSSAIKSLLKSTLSKRDSTTRDKYFLYVLQTRTGLFYFILTFLRIMNLSFWKKGIFQELLICNESVTKDCIERYNEDFVDNLKNYTQIIRIGIIILGLLVSMLTYKWRYLANYIWLLEVAIDIVSAFAPNFYNYDRNYSLKDFGDIQNLSPTDFAFTLFYTDQRYQLFIPCFNVFFDSLFTSHVIYLEPRTVKKFVETLLIAILQFVWMLIGGMMITYV